ncbi:C39 family peptidase [Mycobacterium vicinigordonae]|uniref:C39 family peptidase n=1 Tax=Mycobacterium vicinigordonae TaxID=1719132 RepID=A0A7D6IKC1_9MYCO|nr:C39 family peptidase [Mycobacterium vicinigordonae]QLL06200.1 C39 family peptidase [Mycobacterium vicinigordonae]
MRSRLLCAAKAILVTLVITAAGATALSLASPASAAAGITYGNPAAAAKWWRYQKYDDCVLMASADVVGQMTGSEPSEDAIINLAQSTPSTMHPGSIYIRPTDEKNPNSGNGTSRLDIPALLGHYGVGAQATDEITAETTGLATGMKALQHYLGGGRAVIVSVNAEMIWGEPIESKDDDGNPVSDHAVVVTGVDTAGSVVHLNDSGTRSGRDERIPLDLFTRAWATSHYFLVFTGGTIKP